jgi:hypothetical protein
MTPSSLSVSICCARTQLLGSSVCTGRPVQSPVPDSFTVSRATIHLRTSLAPS